MLKGGCLELALYSLLCSLSLLNSFACVTRSTLHSSDLCSGPLASGISIKGEPWQDIRMSKGGERRSLCFWDLSYVVTSSCLCPCLKATTGLQWFSVHDSYLWVWYMLPLWVTVDIGYYIKDPTLPCCRRLHYSLYLTAFIFFHLISLLNSLQITHYSSWKPSLFHAGPSNCCITGSILAYFCDSSISPSIAKQLTKTKPKTQTNNKKSKDTYPGWKAW
jgi:hypothetical protein